MTDQRRREYGTGGLSKRSSDGRWVGTIEAGWTAQGTRRRIVVTAKTRAEARRKLQAKQNELEAHGAPDVSGRTTVKSWAVTWLDTQSHRLRPETFTSHRSAVNTWIVPTIGHKRIDTLNPGDLRALEDAQRKAGRTSSTRLRTHAVLMKMLRDALLEGHRVPERVLAAPRPAKSVNDREALTVTEAIKILEVSGTVVGGSRWAVALLQGLRPAECLGLTWDAVDLDQGLLHVSWQLQTLPYLDRKAGTFRIPDGYEVKHLEGAWHLTRPKTSAGWRVVPMVPGVDQMLRDWKRVRWSNPHNLVWSRVNGKPISKADDTEEWRGIQGAAEIGHPAGRYYDRHETRHTTVTLLLEAGVDPGVVTAIVGHSSIVTSRGYQHVSQDQARIAMGRIAGRLQLDP